MRHIIEFVDKAYCINLDHRKDRWDSAQKEFSRIGIQDSVTRVSAIPNENPEQGCLESHQLCIRDAMNNRYENILILEDDVTFLQIETGVLNSVTEFLSSDTKWDLFFFGGLIHYPARFVHKNVFESHIYCAHAYIVNSRSFDKILLATPPIDKWYANWNTVSYGLNPLYAVQGKSFSDIRKAELGNRESNFSRTYELYVKPIVILRWVNFFREQYLKKLDIILSR